MYRYGAMVINLARWDYCDAGVCMSVWLSVGMCLCIRVSAAQYHSITSLNVGQYITQLYIEITGYICRIPGEAFWKYTGGGSHWHIKKGVLITGTLQNRGGGGILSQEQLLHTSADISRFLLMVLNCHTCVY